VTIVQTVEQATQVAIDFLRKYYSFVYPMSARKENSYFRPSYVRVKIAAETGALEDFKVTLGPLL